MERISVYMVSANFIFNVKLFNYFLQGGSIVAMQILLLSFESIINWSKFSLNYKSLKW